MVIYAFLNKKDYNRAFAKNRNYCQKRMINSSFHRIFSLCINYLQCEICLKTIPDQYYWDIQQNNLIRYLWRYVKMSIG